MKSLLQGTEAVPMEGGRVIAIRDGKLQTFSPKGERELLVQTEDCLYDTASRNISSAGSLRAQTADGRFSIEGLGFTWHTTNSSLLISNAVHTFIHPDLLRGQTTSNRLDETPGPIDSGEGILIDSDTFRFMADEGTGIYRDNVRVLGTNMAITAGELAIKVPTAERRLESISAKQSVTMDYGEIHATGERVLYSALTGVINATGQAIWRAEQREGRADSITIDRSNRIFVATGNSWLKIPGQTLGPASLLPTQGASRQERVPTNSFLEIRADTYELRTNRGVFQRNVKVVERRGEEATGTLTCGELTVDFSGTNQVDQLLAEHNVSIQQDDKRMTGQKALFTGADGVLVMSGEPAWQYGRRQGKGDELRVNSRDQQLIVRGNASMRLPAEEFGHLTTIPGQANPPTTPPASKTDPAHPEYADVYSETYTFAPSQARFVGGVYMSHPQVNWACEDLTVQLSAAGPVENIQAEKGVSFHLLDRSGQKVHGIGDRAIYTYSVKNAVTNDLIKLMGSPARLERVDPVSGNTNRLQSSELHFDRANNNVSAPDQRYSIQGWGKVSTTNVFGPTSGNPLR